VAAAIPGNGSPVPEVEKRAKLDFFPHRRRTDHDFRAPRTPGTSVPCSIVDPFRATALVAFAVKFAYSANVATDP
jgi:hypothetical protein